MIEQYARNGIDFLSCRVAGLMSRHDRNGDEGYLRQKRLEELSVVGIIEEGKSELRMLLPIMRRVIGQRVAGMRGLLMVPKFSIEIFRKHRVDSSTVHMSGFPMTMIRFRVHMKQGDSEHPYNNPAPQQGL